ncbi:MAG: hypothetical protein HY908_18410, partial [Myxococcales bacterium]|nr:hypothetical protein [Myxococcales bacterium]
ASAGPAAAASAPAPGGALPSASAAPVALPPALPVFRAVSPRTGHVVLEALADGRVKGGFLLPTARLEAPGRLVTDGGERVFRIAADGTLLDGDVPFAHFVDDHTVAVEPWMPVRTVTLRPDGTVAVVGVVHEPAGDAQGRIEREVRRETLRVEGADPGASRDVLFVLLSVTRAAAVPDTGAPTRPADPAARELAAGVAYGIVAAVVLGDIVYQSVTK